MADCTIDLWDGILEDQKRSGRCWIYASLVPLRLKTGIRFSTNYIYYFDQLEKSRAFLNRMREKRDVPLHDPELSELLREPVSSVGQWCYFAALAEQYGLIPRSVMPDTEATEDGTRLTRLLNERLRYGAKRIRAGENASETLHEVEAVLREQLGTPPEGFEWDGIAYTPMSFFWKRCRVDFHESVMLMHHPSEHWPVNFAYHETETPERRAPLLTMLSVDMDTIKALALRQLREGEPVVISCDVRHCGSRKDGLLDLALGNGLPQLSKAEAIVFREINACHVMCIDGMTSDGRWRVQDSHGPETGTDGHYAMTDAWFDAYVLSAVVKKEYLPQALRDALENPAFYMPKSERF